MKIIPDYEAARLISTNPGRYACYLGAGASYDAGIPLANAICDDIAALLKPIHVQTDQEFIKWRSNYFHWDEVDERYANSLQALPDPIHRIDYFRKLLNGKQPTFVHYALALLMQNGIFKRTAITTNFDKLIEYAFILQGQLECQPIRVEEEAKYWEEQTGKFYVLKIHGDCDTYNIANIHKETVRINNQLQSHVRRLVCQGGLVVIGTAGNERSIQNLFDDLETEIGGSDRVLEYGILWAVHINGDKPKALSGTELERLVRDAVMSNVNKHIRQMLERASEKRNSFCYFPIWGAASFFDDLIFDVTRVDSKSEGGELLNMTKRYLDHDTRLNRIFSQNGLTAEGVKKHIAKLRENREQMKIGNSNVIPEPQLCITAKSSRGGKVLRVFQGDITDNRLLKSETLSRLRQAVVSPEDTCISAGGGVAYKLARKAGLLNILNELDKIGTITIGDVAVTSGGSMPVAYILHAAAGEVRPDGEYYANKETVFRAIQNVLYKAKVLGVSTVWCPLLASGRGGLSYAKSLSTICDAVSSMNKIEGIQLNVVVWWSNLEKSEIRRIVKKSLPRWKID